MAADTRTVAYQLTVADLVDARAHVYNNLPLVRAVGTIPFGLALGAALLGAFQLYRQNWSGVAVAAMSFFGGLALIAWVLVANRWLLPPSARKQLSRSKGLQAEVVARWDDDAISFTSTHGNSRWPWRPLQWQESAGGLLLWPSDRTYHYVPKRVLADGQVSDIRASLTSCVGPSGRRRVQARFLVLGR